MNPTLAAYGALLGIGLGMGLTMPRAQALDCAAQLEYRDLIRVEVDGPADAVEAEQALWPEALELQADYGQVARLNDPEASGFITMESEE